MREIIIDTDQYYQFSSGRPYPIVIYEYLGDGNVEKLHEGFIDSSIDFLKEIRDTGIIWIDSNEPLAYQFSIYLANERIATITNYAAYQYIKENRFKKRFISYWIQTKPNKYGGA